MINFESELDQAGVTSLVRTTVPQVTDTLTVRRETRTTEVGKAPATWTAQDLQLYVVKEIEARFGEFPRDPMKEKGIFESFAKRHKELAGPIAVFAFDLCKGIWKGSPISVNRFCKNSDPYFADIIADKVRPLPPKA